MSEQIVEDSWPLGWIPSSSEQADFGQASQGLLRIDNLTLDERGSLRLINRPTASGSVPGAAAIQSINSAYINSLKLRYAYDAAGNLYRNYGTGVALTVYDLLIGSGGTVPKCGFGNALGHIIACAGTLQFKDRGDIQWPLQIPQPAPPVVSNEAANVINLSDLDGSGNYTNWTSVASTNFVNSSTNVNFQPPSTNVAVVQAIYGSTIDTTDFGVTGQDDPNDPFVFTIKIDDPTQLNWFKIEFILNSSPGSSVTDEYWAELDYANFASNTNPNNPYIPANPFTLTPGIPSTIYIARSSFQRLGNNNALTWADVTAIRFSVGFFGTATFTLSNIFVQSGVITGAVQYVAVELNDTGQFLQFSVASTQVAITAAVNHISVDRSGTACDSQSNNIRFYRNDAALGQFIEVNRQTGAYGFTPAPFIDSLGDDAALQAAAVDTSKILQFFRTQLPTDIIGMIYFAARVIYLTTNSLLPSFQLDFGSWDSRFEYQLNSTNTELCLFIAKLSVGTFIVATTVDFYQVTGDFTLQTTTNPDGTTTTIQNVVIVPLGISDPAVNRAFIEVEGTILYMSATGLRSMVNGVSSLLNTTTDLLFRNEERFGFPPVALQPNDLSLIGMVSSGTRTYMALPLLDGTNVIFVNTYNPPLPTELRGSNYWRAIILGALCMNKEQDGTVIYGDSTGKVATLETAFTGTLPIHFLTQFNFGQHPSQTKTIGSILMNANTGNNALTLTIDGLKEDGTTLTYTSQFRADGLKILAFDPHEALVDCVSYQIEITGDTDTFELNYIITTTVQEYPPITFYALIPFTNFGKDTLKKLAKWGIVVDTLGNEITLRATADNRVINSTVDESAEPQGISTEFWQNDQDIAALDWQLEVIAPNGMHFFKFMPADILQVFPPGRLIDQVGPLDIDREGIVFGFRLRIYNTGTTIHYEALESDEVIYTDDILTSINEDSTYEVSLPKGINGSVFRLNLTAPTMFYRFSIEFKIRSTGKETEQKWVKINAR